MLPPMRISEQASMQANSNRLPARLARLWQRQASFAFLIIVAAVCSAPPVTLLGAAEQPSARLPIIEKLQQLKNHTGIGAVSYALVEHNTIIATGGMGEYALDNPRQVTDASLFRVGSITKTFTSLALMHIVEQGKLKLDQAVKTLIPDVPLDNPWPDTPVTLAMLLEHTAGLQDLTREEFDYPDPLSLEDALNLKPAARQVHWHPGYHYAYSNLGAGYVGRVIESTTREDYDSWFEREILLATGMHDSRLRWTKKLEQNLVSGYDSDLKTKIPYWHTLFRPFGGLNTTARDMAKFLLLFSAAAVPDNSIVTRSAIDRMETPETSLAAKAGLKSGYGLGIRNGYFKGQRIYSHGGDGDGYLAEFAYSKDSQRAYFVVINAFRHEILHSFTDLLNNWLIEHLPQVAADNAASSNASLPALSSSELLALTGDYREVARRFPFQDHIAAEIVRIKHSDNALLKCHINTGSCIKIIPVSANLFRTEQQPDASIAFVKAEDGKLYLQADFGSYQRIPEH